MSILDKLIGKRLTYTKPFQMDSGCFPYFTLGCSYLVVDGEEQEGLTIDKQGGLINDKGFVHLFNFEKPTDEGFYVLDHFEEMLDNITGNTEE